MPRFLVTYDLKTDSDPHSKFIAQARLQRWKRWLKIGSLWKELPNTTFIGSFSDQKTAIAKFDEAIRATEIEIGRRVIVEKRYLVEIGTGNIVSNKTSASEPSL